MATASTVCKRAIRLLTTNRSPSTDELTDALEALNARLDSLRNDELFAYARQAQSLTLVAAQYVYTIGPSGDLSTTRPVAIEAAWIESGGTSYGVDLITDEEYAAIPDKTATATWPTQANYKATMTTGTLTVWRVPTAAGTMKLLTRVVPSSFSAITDTLALPPGWEEFLVSELAIVLAPEYDQPIPQSVMGMNVRARNGIKVINSRPIPVSSELPMLVGRPARSNILTDQ